VARATVIIERKERSGIMASFCLQQVSPANAKPAPMVASGHGIVQSPI
jgi:hypothetical protein